ncbi:MAG: ABC transporter permease [Puia sp.]|nr:ABC transporter permease [Puia sp.]
MIRNYIKIAFRSISRHKTYTLINILGLALGICSCIVIYLIASFDFSFDRFHPGQERIFRVVGEATQNNEVLGFANSPVEEEAGFQTQIPGFEATAGIHLYGASITIPNGKKPAKTFDSDSHQGYGGVSTIITWPGYFDIFQYDWLAGNARTALNEPYKVVLSEKRAHLYFGGIPLNEMIGKTVIYDDSVSVSVSGIVKDWDHHTDFPYTDFISIGTVKNPFLHKMIPTDNWSSLDVHRSMAFVKLTKNTTAAEVNAKLAAYLKEHVKFKTPGFSMTARLQPLSDIHFTKEYNRGDDGDGFRKAYMPVLYALMGLAAFILLIAVVNFINLSTAQSVRRAKEIGVRKVLGSSKTTIIYQFLTETGVITLFAVLLSVLLVNPVLALFSSFIPIGIVFHPLEASTLLFLVAVTLGVCLLAGFYPAKIMASFLPSLNLKGPDGQTGKNGINLRKALIVFQFTISLTFIIGALVIGKQIRFMDTSDKGFNTDAIVTVDNWNAPPGKMSVFAESLRHLSGISGVILQGNAPMGFVQHGENFRYKGKYETNLDVISDYSNKDFVPFYGIKLLAGRNLLAGDSVKELLINETMSKALGFAKPADAVDKILYGQSPQGEKPYPIAGVVADYHTGSFQEAIRPTVIENAPEKNLPSVAIKLAGGEKNREQVKSTASKIEAAWKEVFPGTPLRSYLLNDAISQFYEQERKTAWLMNVAVGITVFISCMGLFGLGMFTAERKAKEIGIRKVLGASAARIVTMLNKDFVPLVLLAIVIASPLAWYLMNKWLEGFAYRTSISWWVFALAGLGAITIALATVSFQAIKAAIANPVHSLRSE